MSNSGRGGSNLYHFVTEELRTAFFTHVEQWKAGQSHSYSEAEDILIAELADEHELRTDARKLLRQGHGQVLLIEKRPAHVTPGRTEPDHYDETYLLGCGKNIDPAVVAAQESAERWRVILTA